jgi:hypothetical protein
MAPMKTPGRARLGVAALFAAGCAGSTEPKVTITDVTPAAAYSDATTSLVIHGGPFRPIYDIDTSGGHETLELGAFTAFIAPSDGFGVALPADQLMWLSTSELAATLPAGINAGSYDVEVRDPRGAVAMKKMGFVSLGPDQQSPTVTIDEPESGTIVASGAEVPVAFTADDGPGYLRSMVWKVATSEGEMSGSCPVVLPVHRTTCRFLFVVPTPQQNGEPLSIVATVTDTGTSAPAMAETTLAIGLPPIVQSFDPREGPAAGGTPITITGDHFIAGTEVLVGGAPLVPLVAGGGIVVSDTVIQGLAPSHDPGLVTVTVRTGSASVDASGKFSYVGRPEVRALTPTMGPIAGCTPVTIVGKYFRESEVPGAPLTSVVFGSDPATGAPLQCASWKSDNRIEGLTPAGAGAVSVFAIDPVGGVGGLPLAFTYLDTDMPLDGAPDVPYVCRCPPGATAP